MIVKLCIIVINDNAIYCLNLEIKSILSNLHSLCIKRSMHWLIGPKIQYNFLWLLYQNKLTSSVQTWIKNNSLKWLNPDFLSCSFTGTINRVGNIYASMVPEITFSISLGSSFIVHVFTCLHFIQFYWFLYYFCFYPELDFTMSTD